MTNKRTDLRVFVGPHEIAGYYSNLTSGLMSLGVDVDFITYQSHRFGYGGETHQPLLLRGAKVFNRFRRVPGLPLPLKVICALPGMILSSIWAIKSVFLYDVYVFSFGRSLLPLGLDLPLLRALGKTVISNLAHGSEARPIFIDGGYLTKEGVPASTKLLFFKGKQLARMTSHHLKYASVVIGAPFSSSQYLRGPFINIFSLGIPCNGKNVQTLTIYDNISSDQESNVIRILHSPSHPAAKGSPIIIRAIENLKKQGYLIEFVLVHGRPFPDVLREIHRCDFVIDQIYSDTPMSGFATEAAWLGKPAIVGGYCLELLKQYVPATMWPPSKTCHPDEVESSIEELILDREQRLRLGMAAQSFVRTRWNSVEVAKRFLRLIEGDIPESWWINSEDVVYFDGWGQSQDTSRRIIRDMVSKYGVSSLQLSHRPELEKAFLKYAGIN